MIDGTRNWRRFFRLRLRTMLVLVTFCAVLIGVREWICQPYQAQHDAKVKLESLGGMIRSEPAKLGWLRYVVDEEGFENVVELDLYGSEVADIELAPICRLTQLRKLVLRGEEIADLSMEYVGKLSNLQELDIAETAVSDAGLQKLVGCSQLEKISLPSQVTDVGIAHLRNCTRLHTVHGGNISLEGWSQLADARLRSLAIWAEQPGGNDWKLLSKLKHLREIEVREIDDAEYLFAQLTQMSDLKRVTASSTSIDDDAIAKLMRVPNLRSVDLYATRVSISGLKALLSKPTLRDVRAESSRIFPEQLVDAFLQTDHLETCQIATPWVARDGYFSALYERLTDEEKWSTEGKSILPIPQGISLLYAGLQAAPFLRPIDFSLADLKGRSGLHFSALEGDFDLRTLNHIETLRHLTVPDTIDDAGLEQVAELTQLESLSVNSSRITSSGLRALEFLKNLRDIKVDGMWLTKEDKEWLAETFPNAELQFQGRSVSPPNQDNLHWILFSNLSGASQNAVAESTSRAHKIARTWPQRLGIFLHGPIADIDGATRFLDLPNTEEIWVDIDVLETKPAMEALARNRSLERLTLNGASVGDDEVAIIRHLNLSALGLRRTGVTPSCLAHIKKMPLRSLEFDWWPRTENRRRFFESKSQFSVLAEIPTLRELIIDGATIDDDDLASIASLTQLTRLSISGDSITKNGVQSLCKLDSLQALTIKLRGSLTPKLLSPLGQLPELKELALDVPGMLRDLRAYRSVLPNINVVGADSCFK